MPETGGLVRLVTPLGTLTFNDYHQQSFYNLEAFEFHRDVRSQVDPFPQRSGAVLGGSWFKSSITVLMKVTVYTSDFTTREIMIDNIMGYVNSMLNTSGTLLWTPTGRTAGRQLSVRMIDYPIIDDTSQLFKTLSFSLISDDAVSLSQTLQSVQTTAMNVGATSGTWSFGTAGSPGWEFGTPAPAKTWEFGTDPGGGAATVGNNGNVETWPTIRVQGTITAPTIINTTSNLKISLPTLTVPPGAYAEINTKNQTVLYNGDPALTLLSTLDIANSTFFSLAPGSTGIRMTATSFDANAKATILWRDAWA